MTRPHGQLVPIFNPIDRLLGPDIVVWCGYRGYGVTGDVVTGEQFLTSPSEFRVIRFYGVNIAANFRSIFAIVVVMYFFHFKS